MHQNRQMYFATFFFKTFMQTSKLFFFGFAYHPCQIATNIKGHVDTPTFFTIQHNKMPKKNNANKDMTQKVDKNRPKSKNEKKEEQKKHKLAVSDFVNLSNTH